MKSIRGFGNVLAACLGLKYVGPVVITETLQRCYDEYGDFCSWDSNNDNVFGEVNGSLVIDEVDLSPDLFVGRILCDNRSEVQLVVDKIINYENNAYNSDWFKRIVLFGGDLQSGVADEATIIESGN